MSTSLFARLPAWFHGDGNGGCGACYGVTASFVSVLVFCVLVATASVWKAFLFAGLALAAFGLVACLAPESGRRGAEREVAAGVPWVAACRTGLGKAATESLPTFAYASRGAEAGDADLDLECGGSGQPCSVCLEDLEDGEMVRQLPACKHLFHVECIDMWLHSHATCPVCRCDLSPPRTVTAKVAAVEMEPPADDALPPV
ncbi:RING-H2 finger protein ATL32-like [Triticum dicoccoides]|uniref:RING-H2 finger protein ATL32-like n=1 Tax=Triticum dicoccoides TaxID=85692 RepID=UPI001891A322|nr:RING-H2 finger protein ATL32-like [Triticum dicoccoides]